MIEVSGYAKRFGRHVAVQDLSFTARPGEIFALLGPNGAGKTTTIRAIVGLTRPSAGAVRVNGFDVWRAPLAAKAALGYIPDRPHLYGKLTGRELLRFVAGLHGQDRAADIERWLAFFGLTHFGNELTETYSHGMRQKLTIIAALLPEPRALVVDEPMVGLDPRAAKQVRELLRGFADRGGAVLLTTHSLPLAESVADRILVLDRGRVLGLGTLDELRARTGTQAGGVEGDSLERVFFRLLEDEEAERQRTAAGPLA